MSREQASEFLKRVSGDKAAAEKFREVFHAALVEAGGDAGFKFSRAELDAALTELKTEIPEGELKGVAGGRRCFPSVVPGYSLYNKPCLFYLGIV